MALSFKVGQKAPTRFYELAQKFLRSRDDYATTPPSDLYTSFVTELKSTKRALLEAIIEATAENNGADEDEALNDILYDCFKNVRRGVKKSPKPKKGKSRLSLTPELKPKEFDEELLKKLQLNEEDKCEEQVVPKEEAKTEEEAHSDEETKAEDTGEHEADDEEPCEDEEPKHKKKSKGKRGKKAVQA